MAPLVNDIWQKTTLQKERLAQGHLNGTLEKARTLDRLYSDK